MLTFECTLGIKNLILTVMTTQINTLSLSRLTLAAHFQFHKLVNNKIKSYGTVDLHLEQLAPLYAAAVAEERAVIGRPISFAETAQMISINHERNKTVSQAFNLVNTFLKSVIAAEVASARRIHVLLGPYKGIQDHEYYRKTTEIERLFITLQSASTADISTLALASTIEQMGIKNEAFKKLLRKRSEVISTQTPIRLASSRKLRSATDEIYYKITTTINSFATAMPSPELEAFTTTINSLILQFKHVISAKHAHKSSKPSP